MSIFTRRANQHSKGVVEGIELLRRFMPRSQLITIQQNLVGEEGAYFRKLVTDMAEKIRKMPATYQTEGVEDKIAVLHYFYGMSDWYIIEKDVQGYGNAQAFGFAILNRDIQNAELGYISIHELVGNSVELDLHFDPTPLSEIKKKKGF